MKYLDLAANIALGGDRRKRYLLAAVIVRNDGAIVVSQNSMVKAFGKSDIYESTPSAHAEARALRKADSGCTLYVARVLKKDNSWAMSKPCAKCQTLIKNKNVSKVYYTIAPGEYGVWDVTKSKRP